MEVAAAGVVALVVVIVVVVVVVVGVAEAFAVAVAVCNSTIRRSSLNDKRNHGWTRLSQNKVHFECIRAHFSVPACPLCQKLLQPPNMVVVTFIRLVSGMIQVYCHDSLFLRCWGHSENCCRRFGFSFMIRQFYT